MNSATVYINSFSCITAWNDHKVNRVFWSIPTLDSTITVSGHLPRTWTPAWYFELVCDWRGCREKASGSATHLCHKGFKAIFSSQKNKCQSRVSALLSVHSCTTSSKDISFGSLKFVGLILSTVVLLAKAIVAQGWGDSETQVPV